MLPKPEYPPTGPSQTSSHTPIPCLIPRDLLIPVRQIAFWQRVMLGTPMPKTAVNKNGKALGDEHKIRSAFQRNIPPPPDCPRRPKNFDKAELRTCVPARANTRHRVRPLPHGHIVGHDIYGSTPNSHQFRIRVVFNSLSHRIVWNRDVDPTQSPTLSVSPQLP